MRQILPLWTSFLVRELDRAPAARLTPRNGDAANAACASSALLVWWPSVRAARDIADTPQAACKRHTLRADHDHAL